MIGRRVPDKVIAMKSRSILMVLAVAAAFSAGCFGYERRSSLGPSGTGAAALVGSWTSGSLIPQPNQCSDFTWDVTEQTGNSASGRFGARCAGDLTLTGTARGTLNGSLVNWSAEADATAPGLTGACRITLSGTAELLVDSIRIPYSGNTCLGPVSGIETVRRR
jgi:hypothetical protein